MAAVPRTCPTYQTRLFSSLFSTFLRNPTSPPPQPPPPSPRPYPPTVLDIPGPSSDCRLDGLSGLTTLSREDRGCLPYERFILVSCFFLSFDPLRSTTSYGGDCVNGNFHWSSASIEDLSKERKEERKRKDRREKLIRLEKRRRKRRKIDIKIPRLRFGEIRFEEEGGGKLHTIGHVHAVNSGSNTRAF